MFFNIVKHKYKSVIFMDYTHKNSIVFVLSKYQLIFTKAFRIIELLTFKKNLLNKLCTFYVYILIIHYTLNFQILISYFVKQKQLKIDNKIVVCIMFERAIVILYVKYKILAAIT